jgi:hypothetical protein
MLVLARVEQVLREIRLAGQQPEPAFARDRGPEARAP